MKDLCVIQYAKLNGVLEMIRDHETLDHGSRAFHSFVQSYDTAELRRSAQEYAEDPDMETEPPYPVASSAYLQVYLDAWLAVGGGVEWSGGDYTTWLRTVVNVADAVMQQSVSCNFIGTPDRHYSDGYARPIIGVHHPRGDGHDYLDPDRYAVAAYRWERRGSGLLQLDYSRLDDHRQLPRSLFE